MCTTQGPRCTLNSAPYLSLVLKGWILSHTSIWSVSKAHHSGFYTQISELSLSSSTLHGFPQSLWLTGSPFSDTLKFEIPHVSIHFILYISYFHCPEAKHQEKKEKGKRGFSSHLSIIKSIFSCSFSQKLFSKI